MRLGRVRSHHSKMIQDALRDAALGEQKATEAFSRVRKDYARGAISAEDWTDLRPELLEERDAARQELKRLRLQEQELVSRKVVSDLEAATLLRLQAIKRAIDGLSSDPDGIAAVRQALSAAFERFIVRVDVSTKQGSIEAIARPEATNVEGEELRPVMRRLPLELSEETTLAAGLLTLPDPTAGNARAGRMTCPTAPRRAGRSPARSR